VAVFVDKNFCRGCGICIDICPVEALTLDIIPVVDADKCTECGACITACPSGAIAVQGGVNSPQYTESMGRLRGRGFIRGTGRGRGRRAGRGMGWVNERGSEYTDTIQHTTPRESNSQDSLDGLRSKAEILKQQLEEIQKRINRLKSNSK